VEKIIACTAEQCVCGKCGAETKVLGYDESEVLNVKPAEYYVEVIQREKRACKPGSPATGLRRWGGSSARSRA
jgi:transposase